MQYQDTRHHPAKEPPIFSVILPTRDRADMLRRAVSSVCRQSFQSFELIVVDDGSKESCRVDLPKDRRIRLIRNPSSLGVAQARNVGIDAARGTFISFLDDDDEYLSSFLSSTYTTLKDAPDEVGVSWCGVKFIDYPSEADRALTIRIEEFAANTNGPTLLQYFLSIGTGHGVTIKASCLKAVGPFNSALKVASDTDMFFRILEQGFSPLWVPGVHIVRHNHHGDRLTSATLYPERVRTWEEWLFIEHSEFLDRHPLLRNGFGGYVSSLKRDSTRDNWLLSRFLEIKSWFATACRKVLGSATLVGS